MDVEKIRTFVTAAKCRSFSEAAERLYLTTSTVTKHIYTLEQLLGISLFERHSHGIQLTREGAKRLCLAEQIVSAYDLLLSGTSEKQRLDIYSFPSIQRIGLPRFLLEFSAIHPGISIEIFERHTPVLLKMLMEQQCELTFLSRFHMERTDIEYLEVTTERIYAVLTADHPLAKSAELSLKQLEHEEFIFLAQESGLLAYYRDCCVKSGFQPKIRATSLREDSILSYVRSGVGVTLMGDQMLKLSDTVGIKQVPLKEPIYTGSILARKKGGRLSPPARLFWQYMNTVLQDGPL